jgi:hypothetical protein
MCASYIQGIIATIERMPTGIKICFPANVDTKQMAAVFTKMARENPQWLHREAVFGVVTALQTAFPCAAGETPAWTQDRDYSVRR